MKCSGCSNLGVREGEGGGGQGGRRREDDDGEGHRRGEGVLWFLFCSTLVAIGVNLVPIKVKTSTWFGFATSGEGEFDESQVVVINQKSLVIRLKENLNPPQVRMAIVFYSMLGIAIFLLLGLLVFKFIKGGPSRKTKKISSTLESSDDSGED